MGVTIFFTMGLSGSLLVFPLFVREEEVAICGLEAQAQGHAMDHVMLHSAIEVYHVVKELVNAGILLVFYVKIEDSAGDVAREIGEAETHLGRQIKIAFKIVLDIELICISICIAVNGLFTGFIPRRFWGCM